MAAFEYSLQNVRNQVAQWDATLTDADLSTCAENGQFYTKALTEIRNALYAAGYNVTTATPLAYQLSQDLLTEGVSLYFIESKRSATYAEGYNPLAGMWGRYRQKLKSIMAGARWGEFPTGTRQKIGVAFSPARPLSMDRPL